MSSPEFAINVYVDWLKPGPTMTALAKPRQRRSLVDEAYAELKWEEVLAYETAPHPIEFQMYYSS